MGNFCARSGAIAAQAAAVSSAAGRFAAQWMATLIPARANSSATPFPSPRLDPVTRIAGGSVMPATINTIPPAGQAQCRPAAALSGIQGNPLRRENVRMPPSIPRSK
jgi:hypothetical protein